jgi:hypothetical protein
LLRKKIQSLNLAIALVSFIGYVSDTEKHLLVLWFVFPKICGNETFLRSVCGDLFAEEILTEDLV